MQRVLDAATAHNTRVAQAADWQKWERWCALHRFQALPAHPDVLRYYLTDKAAEIRSDGRYAYAPTTLSRWASTINKAHAGLPRPGDSPLVRDTLRGIRAERKTPPRQMDAFDPVDLAVTLRRMRADAQTWIERVRERRDAAMLLWGFWGAFRASEVVGLRLADVVVRRQVGLHVVVRQSKTDPYAEGQTKALIFASNHEMCAVCAYWRWRQVLDAGSRAAVISLTRGTDHFDGHVCRSAAPPAPPNLDQPVFRGVTKSGLLRDGSLTRGAFYSMVKRRAQQAGLDPEVVHRLSPHSLRAGFITAATREGASREQIQRQSGQRDPRTVERYVRGLAPEEMNAVQLLKL